MNPWRLSVIWEGAGPGGRTRDKKDSDSTEIQLDIEMNQASQVLDTLTFVVVELIRESLDIRAARSLENFEA